MLPLLKVVGYPSSSMHSDLLNKVLYTLIKLLPRYSARFLSLGLVGFSIAEIKVEN